jgi:hypothetical protein
MKKVPLQFVGMFTFFMLFSIINVYAGDVTVVSQERNVNIECRRRGVDLFNVTRVEIITEESNESE